MKHTHKYQKRNLTKNPKKPPYIVYACVLPNCNYYCFWELLIGKLAICWRCTKEFKLERKHINPKDSGLAKPHCDDCTKTNSVEKIEKKESIKDLMDKLGLS